MCGCDGDGDRQLRRHPPPRAYYGEPWDFAADEPLCVCSLYLSLTWGISRQVGVPPLLVSVVVVPHTVFVHGIRGGRGEGMREWGGGGEQPGCCVLLSL